MQRLEKKKEKHTHTHTHTQMHKTKHDTKHTDSDFLSFFERTILYLYSASRAYSRILFKPDG